VAITVQRVNGSVGTATVDYTTVSGTATAGADFTPKSGTLTFADGETTKTINVPIVQDTVFEGFSGETFNFVLSNPTGGATLGAPSTAIVTISDDDPAPQISIADTQVLEGNS